MSFTHTITNLPEENEYPKLIRDLLPDIIKSAEGIDIDTKVLDDEEFEQRLRQKSIEEAHELAEATDDDHLLEEIADVKEILDTLLSLKGVTDEQLKEVQDAKRAKRGGFEKKLLMLRKAGE